MKRAIAAIAASSIMLGTAVAPALAITKNYTKDFDHPFVAMVAFYDAQGEFAWRCTGELLAPRVLLTAGHCIGDVSGETAVSARAWFQQDAGTHYDKQTQHDPVSGYPDACAAGTLGVVCATSDELYSFGFDAFAGFPNTHDAGLVILDQAIELAEYGQLAGPGTLDVLANSKGTQDTTFRVSGYGLTYQSGGENGNNYYTISYRERLTAVEKLVNTVSKSTSGYNLQLNGNGAGMGGTCNGDSGGPVFYPEDSNQIVGVTSYGMNTGCRGNDWFYRTDRSAVIGWILDKAGDAGESIVVND